MVAAITWWQRSAWQRCGNIKPGSVLAVFGLAARKQHGCSAASLRHGRASRYQRRAATVRHRNGNEDTGSDSNGRGINNQQSTKSMEMMMMTATTMTMVTKGMVVAAEVQ